MNNQVKISGVVLDSLGKPLEGVNVKIKNANLTTFTDVKGNFSFENNINSSPIILVFSYVGFQTIEKIFNGENLQVFLIPVVSDLEEVVVVGYGAVKKTDLTGSISTLGKDQITQVKGISNVAQALQGQAAGVQVNQASGQPGEGMKIQIRGLNSLGASNDPLYVVDGLPLDGLSAQLNPEDIENISVLKDASSTAIYGSRGANGVVIITTKKGKSGKTLINYSNYLGSQKIRKFADLINAKDFAKLQNEVALNDNKQLPWTDQQIKDLAEGTNWQDLVYRNALVQNHDLNLSGGNENTKYFTSFGYFNQNGIIRNSGFERMSFRGNIEHKLFDKLIFSTNLSIQNSKYNRAQYQSADGGGGIPWATMVMPPTIGVYDENGEYTKFTGVSWGETNPVGISDNWHNSSNSLRIIGSSSISYEIIDGLKFKSSIGIDHSYNKGDLYYPGNISLGQKTDPNGQPIFGVAQKSYGSTFTLVNENILEFQRNWGDHKLDAVGGITYQSSKSDDLNSGSGIGFLSDIYLNNNISSAIIKALPSSNWQDNRLMSFLGRTNYSFKDKYYLTLTGRYDGSSRFGASNKFAFFPSAAIAWAISNEEFLKDHLWISNLKLRSSYGESGNQAINNYQTLANISNTDVVFNNEINTAFILASLENSNLKWETTRQFDFGLDFSLLNNRLEFVFDYYNKKTKDLLLNVTLPGSGGFGSVLQNVGVVQNRGIEFLISGTPILKENFKWTSSFNLSANKTKVLDLGNDAYGNPIEYKEIGAGGNWFPTIVGESRMQLYGYTIEGVYKTDQEAIDNGEPNKKAGDYKFKNWDNKGVINDSEDRTVLSKLEPDFTFGFNNKFSIKNFDFSFLLVGSVGNDIVNEFRKYNITLNGEWVPTYEAFNNRWSNNSTDSKFDKPSNKSGSSIRDYPSTLWVENGTYVRLRDVTLGYTFPSRFANSIKLSNIRVYISAQNFLTFTNYTGYDPEVSWSSASINGWDRGNYPSSKSFIAGLRVEF